MPEQDPWERYLEDLYGPPATRQDPGQAHQDPHKPERDWLEVHAGGRVFRDWKTIRVVRPLAAAAGSFEVTYAGDEPLPLRAEDEVTVRLGAFTILRGYVDAIEAELDEDARSVRVSGRDRTAQLVDCSAELEASEWLSMEPIELAKLLAAPFSVEVFLGSGGSAGAREETTAMRPLDKWTTQPGETAWAAIERLSRLGGMLVTSTGDGALRMVIPGQERADAALVQGGNLKRLRISYQTADRYRLYVVQGQAPGSDDGWGDSVAAVEGRALDEGVRLPRTLRIVAESHVTTQSAEARASWEATVRAARSARAMATVAGWRQTPGGRPWLPGLLVPVHAPRLGMRAELLIDQVTFVRGDAGGTTTELELVRPRSYTPEPIPPRETAWSEFAGPGPEDLEEDD